MSNIFIHNHSNRNYVALSIIHLRDTSLSWQAMGMLSFMLSCNQDFKLSVEGLGKCSACGDTATRSALKELREKGYVVVSPIKEGGRIVSWNYDVYESPPDVRKPQVDLPDVEIQHVENVGQSNNIIKDNISTNVEIVRENNIPVLFEDNNSSTKETSKESCEERMFDEFRRVYRGTKRGLRTEFDNFRKKHKDWREVLEHILGDYMHQIQILDANREAGAFVPHPKNLQTYINQRCWEDEITLLTDQTPNDYARQSFDREAARQRSQIAARAATRRAVLDAAIQSINTEQGFDPDY